MTEQPTAEQVVSSEKATDKTADNVKTLVKTVSKMRKWTVAMLLRARKKHGLSRQELSKAIGVSVATISNWEKKITPLRPKYFPLLDAQFPK